MKNFKNVCKPFIIAEIGGNHLGDTNTAKTLIDFAISAKVDAVKFQSYHPDTLVNCDLSPERYKHFTKHMLSLDILDYLAVYAKERGIEFMCSLWSKESIKKLDKHINIHKVGSGDLTNYPLLKEIALLNKPLILSTAMASVREISESLRFIHNINPELMNNNKLAIMHCVAMYEDPKDIYANLDSINKLKDDFPYIEIGYSDHTIGSLACELAMGMGCKLIEKHFTTAYLKKQSLFRDQKISLAMPEMKKLTNKANKITKLLGNYDNKPVEEIESDKVIEEFRRAVYPIVDIKCGQEIKENMLTTLRPNIGIDARDFYNVVGTFAKRDIEAFGVLKWGLLDKQ